VIGQAGVEVSAAPIAVLPAAKREVVLDGVGEMGSAPVTDR